MPCTAAYDALVSVVLTAKVSVSTLGTMGAIKGDTMTASFLADPAWVHREIVGQGVVYDGIGPFGVCDESFKLSFSSGLHAHIKPPPPPAPLGAPIPKDAVSTGSLGLPLNAPTYWFSLMKSRPVDDGAFISTLADKALPGVPLVLYGGVPGTDYHGVFDVRFVRNTVPSIKLKDAFGTYTKGSERSGAGSIHISREWGGNIVLSAEFESLTIGSAKDLPTLVKASEKKA